MDSSICLDAPLSLDFGCSPRFAASAAPAAFCWAFDVAGMGSLLRVIQRANGQRVAPVARRRPSSSFPVQAFILLLEPGRLLLSRDLTRWRSEEHTSELQSLMCISYAVFCLHKI